MYPIQNTGTADTLELFAIGDMWAEYDGQRLAMETMARHGTKQDLMGRILERVRKESLVKAADRSIGIDSSRDAMGYSITRALRAAVEAQEGNKTAWHGATLERDISNLATKADGPVPNGFYLPLGVAARDFNVGTAGQAGNLLGAAKDDGILTEDPLRRISPLAALGATFISGLRTTLTLPRFASATTASWKSETGAATPVLETTSGAELTPKRCPVTMIISRQALLQSTPALDVAITRHLVAAVMEEAENGALNGDGTNDSPVGLRSTSGITTVAGGTDGAQLTFAHLCDLENGPSAAKAPETRYSGFVVNPSTRRWLRTTAQGTGLPYIWTSTDRPLLGHPAAITGLLPSNLTKGSSGAACSSVIYSNDWSSLVLGIYGGGVDILVDRVTMADSGQVRITASLLIGVGVTKPAAYACMDDAKTA